MCATIHIKHNTVHHNIFCQNFMLRSQGMQWMPSTNKSTTNRFISAFRSIMVRVTRCTSISMSQKLYSRDDTSKPKTCALVTSNFKTDFRKLYLSLYSIRQCMFMPLLWSFRRNIKAISVKGRFTYRIGYISPAPPTPLQTENMRPIH